MTAAERIELESLINTAGLCESENSHWLDADQRHALIRLVRDYLPSTSSGKLVEFSLDQLPPAPCHKLYRFVKECLADNKRK